MQIRAFFASILLLVAIGAAPTIASTPTSSTFTIAAGPFSRLVVKQPAPGPHKTMDTTWRTHFEGQWFYPNGTVRDMVPTCVIVPVYQKIRLHFDVVMSWIARLHPPLFAAAALPLEEVEWDVYITETKNYKEDVRLMPLHDERKRGLLQTSQPRFIWRAVFRISGAPAAEFLLDATSFAKAFPVFAANWFDAAFASRVESLVKTGLLTTTLTPSLQNLILTEISHRESSSVGVDQAALPMRTGSAIQPAGAPDP